MHARLFWAAIGGFLTGVFLRSLMPLPYPYALLLGVCACTLLVFPLQRRGAAIVLAAALAACGIGIVRTDLAVQRGDANLSARIGAKVTIEGVVAAEPDVRESGERLSVRALRLVAGSTTVPVSGGVLVLAPPHAGAAYGAVVRASGTLRLPEAFDAADGRRFNYPLFLAKDGILYELAFATVDETGERRSNPLTAAAIGLKHWYVARLDRALPEPEAGFAAGITVGDKRSIGTDLSAAFQRASLIHMVVLSGYNITVVINAAARLLQFAGRSAQFFGSGVIVAVFIAMTGGASSAVRAGAMALLAMYARVSGRVFIALRALGATAAAMVLWNPLTLIYDPSFQLSALATVGLVLFTPLFAARLSRVPERYGIREILSSTLGTQLAVLPLLLYQNGTLSLVALPANLLALIPMPVAMASALLAAGGGALLGPLAPIAGLPAYAVLGYMIAVARFAAGIPYAAISVPAFSAWWIAAAYALLIGAYLYETNSGRAAPERSASRI